MKEKSYKTYVGADLHRLRTHYVAQTSTGKEIASREIENREDLMLDFLGSLPQPVKVTVEATGNSNWFCDVVSGQGNYEVIVAHPRETSAMSGTREKDDRRDARMLATLLRGNLLSKKAYQPTKEERRIRERLRHMSLQTKTKTMYKNKIHSILIQHNIRSPYKDAFCKKGRQFLAEIDLPEEYRTTIDRCMVMIQLAEAFQKEDIEYCEKLAQEDPRTGLLMSIPGISVQLAALIRYETGDIERFDRAESYINYIGLAPGTRGSAGKNHSIGITKEGSSWLRLAFVQAAQTVQRQKGRLSRFYWRMVMKSKNRNEAVVATARKMATIAFYMMKRNQGYYEPLIYSETT